MSRAPFSYKAATLAIDPKVRSSQSDSGDGKQWLVRTAAGEIIGWSDPTCERNSRNAWMRAFYLLKGRKMKAP